MAAQSQYTRGAKTQIRISETASSDPAAPALVYANLWATLNQAAMQGGSKEETDVTTFASDGVETALGLKDGGSVTLSGFLKIGDAAQDNLRAADTDGENRVFEMEFKDGTGVRFVAGVSQLSWDNAVKGVISCTFTLRVSGDVEYVEVFGA